MSRRFEFLQGLVAHGAFIAAIILDGYRRESAGVALYLFSIVSAIFVLPAFIYFVTNPRYFFLLAAARENSERHRAVGRGWRVFLFLACWLYVACWSLSWLLFAQTLPRLIASYAFMCGVITTLLIAKYLFLRTDNTAR
jgi:hypothetical protein